MLEVFDKRFFNELFCYIFKHGDNSFCYFTPLGMITNHELRTSVHNIFFQYCLGAKARLQSKMAARKKYSHSKYDVQDVFSYLTRWNCLSKTKIKQMSNSCRELEASDGSTSITKQQHAFVELVRIEP